MILPDGSEVYLRARGYSGSKGNYEVVIDTHSVIKRTPKGVWVYLWGYLRPSARERVLQVKPSHDIKFILETANKRWAWPTEEEALKSFLSRKRRELEILRSRVFDAEEYQNIAQEALKDLQNAGTTETAASTVRLKSGQYRGPRYSLGSSELWI